MTGKIKTKVLKLLPINLFTDETHGNSGYIDFNLKCSKCPGDEVVHKRMNRAAIGYILSPFDPDYVWIMFEFRGNVFWKELLNDESKLLEYYGFVLDKSEVSK